MKKYKLTTETLQFAGRTLHRIKAVKDFDSIKAGEFGGWIENEKNLSQDDNAWIYGDAMVFDNAEVYGNAKVYGNAEVCGDAKISKTNDILCIAPIGSRNDTTTFFKAKDNKIGVKCGCFTGTIDDFLEAVNETHGENKHAKAYKLACELARVQILED